MTPVQHCNDFDFQQGHWRVKHRRLKSRLCSCSEWEEFEGTCEQQPILGGNANVEDNFLHVGGGGYRAVALRSYDPAAGTWAIWWLDGRSPHTLDVPVLGRGSKIMSVASTPTICSATVQFSCAFCGFSPTRLPHAGNRPCRQMAVILGRPTGRWISAARQGSKDGRFTRWWR